MDFANWPEWLIVVAFIFTLSGNKYFLRFLDRVSARLGIVSVKREEKEIEAERWMREQAEKNTDRFISILESTIRDFRKQSEGRDKTMIEMITNLQQNTEITRLLAQKMISVENILSDIKKSLSDTQKIEKPASD